MENNQQRLRRCYQMITTLHQDIVSALQTIFLGHNNLIWQLKVAVDLSLAIRADKNKPRWTTVWSMQFACREFLSNITSHTRSTWTGEIYACLKSSPLWRFARQLSLGKTMRAHLYNDLLVGEFFHQLLKIGNGAFSLNNPAKACTAIRAHGVYTDWG